MGTEFFENRGVDMDVDAETYENFGVGMDVEAEIFEYRGVDMDVDTEIFENRGVDMDMGTARNRCPPNSGPYLNSNLWAERSYEFENILMWPVFEFS